MAAKEETTKSLENNFQSPSGFIDFKIWKSEIEKRQQL